MRPGTTQVRADPQRIVVLSGDQLDALCALGLQSRIVAAALPDGSTSQPSYLGTVIHDLPGAGTRTAPDLAAIRAANPDLILGLAGADARGVRERCPRSRPRCSPGRPARRGRTTCARSARRPAASTPRTH